MTDEIQAVDTSVIYWDDARIEREMALFPAALQEPYQWLKVYTREECRRDVDVLVTQAKLLGVTIDKTNWTRVLKGRWKMDGRGRELPNPYVSATNLLNAITSLREQKRVELLQGAMPFVETFIFTTIRSFIEKKMRRDRVNKYGVIVGPTGLQKTASYKEIARRLPGCKWIESSDNASMADFVKRLAHKCGAARNSNVPAARGKIMDCFMPVNGQPKCLIIDNTQDMVKPDNNVMGGPKGRQPFYHFIRTLQEETGCAVIESITPEDEETMFDPKSIYLEQFEGRAGGRDGFLRLPNFSPKKDLVLFALALGLKDAGKHEDELAKIGSERGRIRRYLEVLQEAKDYADDDKKPFTITHVRMAIEEMAAPVAR